MFIYYREVPEETVGAKLLFSVMGDNSGLDPNQCWSYTGKVGSVGGENGQTINLPHLPCRDFEVVLHEVLHSLGKFYYKAELWEELTLHFRRVPRRATSR